MVRSIVVILAGLMVYGQPVWAQALTNNNALITVTPATRVTVQGGALNNGDLVNHGVISISGHWMNVDTYDPSIGRLVFNGTSSQNIGHNGEVYQLTFDGGGEKNITSSIEVQDTLDFIDGRVLVPAENVFLIQAAGTVTGGSELSYVEGILFHQGTGYKYYPIGSEGNFRPAELVNVSGTDPVVGVSVDQPNADPVIPLQLLAVSDTRYWQVTQQSGDYQGSQIRIKVGPDESLGTDVDPQDIVVARADSLGGRFATLGQSVFSGTLSDGEVTSSLPVEAGDILAIAVEGFAEERALYVPNALSPAAPDTEDQVVKVYGQQIVEDGFSFRIYNRWGLLVYETNSFIEANTVGWAGESASEEESVGVYHYTLAGKFVSGKPFSRQGTIKIIR